jgi:purine-nucleoside phosphorylase
MRDPSLPASPTASTTLKPSPSPQPSQVAQPLKSHSVDGLSPRSAASSKASNGTQHVRRVSTGQIAGETVPKERIDIINAFLQERVSSKPLIGVVCGSGLGGLSKCLDNQQVIKYEDIPQFPRSTVEGHAGELVFGDLDGIRMVCMRGRFHCYEGYDMRETALPIRVMYLLGIEYLLVTNAAGGLNPDFNVGDLMILNDHLNMPGLSGQHPLIGPNDSRFGGRFTPLSNCYDKQLQDLAVNVAESLRLAHKVRKGAYCFVSGPTYETPTECRFLRLVGGDAVGMSTVPEAIVAAHCGLKVIGLSLITNKALFPGEEREAASHDEVLETVQATQNDIETYVRELLAEVGKQHAPRG